MSEKYKIHLVDAAENWIMSSANSNNLLVLHEF